MLSTSPFPSSRLEPWTGSTENLFPRRTFRWPPLPGSRVQPFAMSHLRNSALVKNHNATDLLCQSTNLNDGYPDLE